MFSFTNESELLTSCFKYLYLDANMQNECLYITTESQHVVYHWKAICMNILTGRVEISHGMCYPVCEMVHIKNP